jgi:tetratricopeptide (TPR) repeat protein
LGHVFYNQGAYAESIPLYREAVRLKEAKFGPDHPSILIFREHLANAYRSAGNTDEAIRLHEQILKQQEAKPGPNASATLHTMQNLALDYRARGRLKDAISLLEIAIQRGRQQPGGFPPFLEPALRELAEIYEQDGQFAKAESSYRDRLAYATWHYSSDDLRTSGVLVQLGDILLKQKKFNDAEPLLRQCLTIREKKQPDDWTTFNARSVLGEALLGLKKYAEAEPLLVQGYDGMKQRQDKILPVYHKLRLSEALARLVQLYEATDQKAKAADWRKKMQEVKMEQKKSKP